MFPINPYFWIKQTNYTLICFTNHGNIISVPKSTAGYYISPATCGITGGIINSNIAKSSESIIVYPNPANENSIIALPYKMQSGRLRIVNAIGQVVLQKEFQNKEEIRLGELPAQGLYFYSIIDNFEGNSYKGKFDYQ